jgi:hypothetical protein
MVKTNKVTAVELAEALRTLLDAQLERERSLKAYNGPDSEAHGAYARVHRGAVALRATLYSSRRVLARYDAQRPDKCEVCGSENCSELWKDQRKCCPDCTCKPVPSEVERLSIVVVRAHEKFVHADMVMAFCDASAERESAIEALGVELRKCGAM